MEKFNNNTTYPWDNQINSKSESAIHKYAKHLISKHLQQGGKLEFNDRLISVSNASDVDVGCRHLNFGIEVCHKNRTENLEGREGFDWYEVKATEVIEKLEFNKSQIVKLVDIRDRSGLNQKISCGNNQIFSCVSSCPDYVLESLNLRAATCESQMWEKQKITLNNKFFCFTYPTHIPINMLRNTYNKFFEASQ